MLDVAPDPSSTAVVRADERRLVGSIGISALGTWSYNVGIAVYAYSETGSTAWVAAATVGRYVPALLITAVGSRWADLLPRRRVAVIADATCALAMLALTVVAVVHAPLVVAIALAALSSGVARIQSAAALASVADLVPESRLARTAATVSTIESVATAAGPALASIVLAIAPASVLFALNGLSFAVSAALLASLRTAGYDAPMGRPSTDTSAPDSTYREAVRVVRPLLVLRALAAFVYGADVVLLAVVATQQLRQGTAGYGWLLAAAGAGGLVGAMWIRSRPSHEHAGPPAVAGMLLYAAPLMLFLAAPVLVEGVAVQLVRGVGCVLVTATVVAALQRTVPAAASGRVFGLTHSVVLVGTSVGALVTPVMLDRWGLESTLLVVALVPAIVTVVAVPALRRFDRDSASAVAALDPRVDLLRQLSIFADASRSTLYGVADRLEGIELPAGQDVVTQGGPSNALYVLVGGTVDVFIDGPEGRRHVRTMTAPSYFGEIGLVHGIARTATVTAGPGCALWSIPSEAFLSAAGQAGLSSALTDGAQVRWAATA